MVEMESSTTAPQQSGAELKQYKSSTEDLNGGYNKSTEQLMVENTTYDQLLALRPSTVQPVNDNDYDQLPALVNKNPGAK